MLTGNELGEFVGRALFRLALVVLIVGVGIGLGIAWLFG